MYSYLNFEFVYDHAMEDYCYVIVNFIFSCSRPRSIFVILGSCRDHMLPCGLFTRSGRILAKLEYLNPGFSKKDRIAQQMVLDALGDQRINPGTLQLTHGRRTLLMVY